MASDLRGWETDPLFAAAEVVQDSADRMQTIYRLALHESSLIGGDHHDSNVVASLKLHQRDLVTAIETTKWQLEDFEKAASLSIIRSKLRTREILVARYRQFVEAIREQICQIEKNLDYSSLRDSIVDTSHVSLNTREEDNLALFLSGVMANPVNNYTKDSCIVEGFLDATDASCSLASTNEIVEERTEDTGNIIMKGAANFIQDSSKRSKSSCAKNGYHPYMKAESIEILQEYQKMKNKGIIHHSTFFSVQRVTIFMLESGVLLPLSDFKCYTPN
uniref:Syntaxin 6/10/61 N-terminal domain-containing protein n=1 Tax=Kalanchoe fedtschenkoi TaxID=63787 RepID=A0A7N0TGP3_KALFE